MQVTISSPIRFVRAPGGSVWARQETDSYPFWKRYLDAFTRVRVLARVSDATEEPLGWRRADGPGVEIVGVPDFVGPLQLAANYFAVRRAIRDAVRTSDALIFRVPCNLAVMARAVAGRDRPYAVEVVGDPYDYLTGKANDTLARPFFQWLLPLLLRRLCADAAACSYVTSSALQKRYPPSDGAVSTYYSSIELPADEILDAPRPVRNSRSRPRLLFVGALEWLYKAPDTAIRAVALCRDRGFDLELAVAGGGRCLPQLQDLARELGVADRVVFLGQVATRAQVLAEMDRADIFVLPSRAEGLPRAMIEAMARGLPCFGTPIAGIPELLPESCLVAVDDALALSQRIEALLGDPDAMQRLSARSLETARGFEAAVLHRRRAAFYTQVRNLTTHWLEERGGRPMAPDRSPARGASNRRRPAVDHETLPRSERRVPARQE